MPKNGVQSYEENLNTKIFNKYIFNIYIFYGVLSANRVAFSFQADFDGIMYSTYQIV